MSGAFWKTRTRNEVLCVVNIARAEPDGSWRRPWKRRRSWVLRPELDHVFVQAGPSVAAGARGGGGFSCCAGQGVQAGELSLSALAQDEPPDAAAGQLVEDLGGSEMGVDDQRAGIAAAACC